MEEMGTLVRRQRKWFKISDYDLQSAELEAKAGRFSACSFWCQQATEKALKALIELTERPLPIHDVFKLAHKLRIVLHENHRELLKELSRRYTESRYDLDLSVEENDDGLAESSRIVDATKEFIVWAKKQSKSPLI